MVTRVVKEAYSPNVVEEAFSEVRGACLYFLRCGGQDEGGATSEANKQLVKRHFEEIFNKKNLAVCNEIMAEEFVEHAAAPFAQSAPGRVNGPQAMRQTAEWLLAQFPDLHMTVEAMIAEGDTVAVRILSEDKPRTAKRRHAADGERFQRPPEPLVPDRGRQAGRALGHARGPTDHAAAGDHPAPGGSAFLGKVTRSRG